MRFCCQVELELLHSRDVGEHARACGLLCSGNIDTLEGVMEGQEPVVKKKSHKPPSMQQSDCHCHQLGHFWLTWGPDLFCVCRLEVHPAGVAGLQALADACLGALQTWYSLQATRVHSSFFHAQCPPRLSASSLWWASSSFPLVRCA